MIQRPNLEIPDWLLFEILLRLPVNSVFKFRVVSKRWLSLASAHYFIRAYASRASSSSRPPWIVLPLLADSGKFPAPPVHDPSDNLIIPRELYLPPQRSIHRNPEIRGVSNGLVLYCNYIADAKIHLYVCNPITRERTKPVALQWRRRRTQLGWGFLTRVDGEFNLESYIVVHASVEPDDPTAIVFSVYRSEVGEWNRFTVDEHPRWLQKSAAVHDGILYWASATGGGGSVIAYDPEANPERQVRLIRDPLDAERTFDAAHSCVECGGELRYFVGYHKSYNGIPGFRIWKLEGGNEWCLLHEVEGSGDPRRVVGGLSWVGNEIVCFDPFDPDVVYLRRAYGDWAPSLVSYDMKLGDYREKIAIEVGVQRYRFPWNHVLVLPPWPTRVAEKKRLERHRSMRPLISIYQCIVAALGRSRRCSRTRPPFHRI